MTAILFALVSYFGWGAGDIFGTFATRKIGAFLTSFWVFVLGLLFASLYIPFAPHNLSNISLTIIVVNLILGALLVISYVVFNEALRIGNASIVGTISGSFSAITVILSLIFLKESLTFNQAISILIILLGILLSSLDLKDVKNGKLFKNKGTLLAIAVMICWGIYWAFIKIPIKEVGWFWSYYISTAVGVVILVLLGIRKAKIFKRVDRGSVKNLLISSLLLTLGTISFNYALSIGTTAIVAPIAGSYTTLFVLLSRFAFKDRLTGQQWVGIIATLFGIVLLAVFSK